MRSTGGNGRARNGTTNRRARNGQRRRRGGAGRGGNGGGAPSPAPGPSSGVRLSQGAGDFCHSLCDPWSPVGDTARVPYNPLHDTVVTTSRSRFNIATASAGQFLKLAICPEAAIVSDNAAGYWVATASPEDQINAVTATSFNLPGSFTAAALGTGFDEYAPGRNRRQWRVVSAGIKVRYIGELRHTAGTIVAAGWDAGRRVPLVEASIAAGVPAIGISDSPTNIANAARVLYKRQVKAGDTFQFTRGWEGQNDCAYKDLVVAGAAGKTATLSLAQSGIAPPSDYDTFVENTCYLGFQAGPFPDVVTLEVDIIVRYEVTVTGPGVGHARIEVADQVGGDLVASCHSRCQRALGEESSPTAGPSLMARVMAEVPRLARTAFTAISPIIRTQAYQALGALLG